MSGDRGEVQGSGDPIVVCKFMWIVLHGWILYSNTRTEAIRMDVMDANHIDIHAWSKTNVGSELKSFYI